MRTSVAIVALAAAAALLSSPASAYRLFQPNTALQNPVPPFNDYIINSPPTALAPFVHWDLREFTNAQLPWTYATAGTPDIDGNGTAGQPADIAAATGAFTNAWTSWQNVNPAIIAFTQGPAASVGTASGIAVDGHNLLSFASSAQDDQQCVAINAQAPAPGGNAALRPFAPVVSPGPDALLTTQPRVDDLVSACIIDGGNSVVESGPVAGDDVEIQVGAVPAGCNVIITAGPNGVVDTPPAGDDVIASCIVAGPNGNCNTDANNQGTAGGPGSLGLTGLFFNNQSGVLQEADVEFNAAQGWAIVAHGAVPPANTFDLEGVAAHEFGHAIGIAHPFDADDRQILNPGPPPAAAAPGAIIVNAGPDGVLRTNPQGDDVTVGTTIREPLVGGNGTADTYANNSPVNNANPAPNDIMRPFNDNTLAANHLLSADDRAACNFLYSWDLGDAPDPAAGFNMYQSLVRSANNGRTLSGVQAVLPALGPAQLFGHPPDRYEWLGPDEDGNAAEIDSRQVDADLFDDGVALPFPMYRGIPNYVYVTITWSDAARYNAGNPARQLNFNGYFDWNDDKVFDNTDLQIWWRGTPAGTIIASPNLSAAGFGANDVVLSYLVTPPANAPSVWSRFRLDLGEDEGRVANINGDNGPAVGVGQFGEVEDYRVATTNPPPTAVVVARFEGTPSGDGVDLAWSTPQGGVSEKVNLYRSTEGVGVEELLGSIAPGSEGGFYHDADVQPGTTYHYRLGLFDGNGEVPGPIVRVEVPALEFALRGMVPTPVGRSGHVVFSLPRAGRATLVMFGVDGRQIRVLADGNFTAGPQQVAWNGHDDTGHSVAPGIYFLKLQFGAESRVTRTVVIR